MPPATRKKAPPEPAGPKSITLYLDPLSVAWLDRQCAARAARSGENPDRLRSVLVREILRRLAAADADPA